MKETYIKSRNSMTLDLSGVSKGQGNAIEGLIGGDRARTYQEASIAAGVSIGTLYTHLRRVRLRHPILYKKVIKIRRKQLSVRHSSAIANAKNHSRAWFRRINKNQVFLYL